MTTRALVLGGGGPIGIAWETGLIAGLAEAGVDLGAADLVVGTSAGAMVGAQVALGRSPESMLASQRALGEHVRKTAAATGDAGPGSAAASQLAPLMAFMERLGAGEGEPEALRREIGAFALGTKTMPEEQWLATFGFLMGADWPAKRFIATAVDAEDGSFVAWERDSGAEFGRAVASSCTVPGVFPPVSINGRRYIDGGMRSATNADLARGYERVIVVAVTAAIGGEAAARYRAALEAELDVLRAPGAGVSLVVPDVGSAAAFGPNLMDGTRRAAVADEGYRQGRAEARELGTAWN